MGRDGAKEKCGVVRAGRPPCKQPAGHGVPGVITGPCSNHGGLLPTVKAKQAKDGLMGEARSMAQAVQLEPMDAMLHVVYGFAGRVSYLARRGLEVPVEQEFTDGRMHPVLLALRQAQLDLARVSHMALQAGVAERRVQMAERTGALISAAFEDALADVGADVLSPELRAGIVRRFAAGLQVLEAGEDPDGP